LITALRVHRKNSGDTCEVVEVEECVNKRCMEEFMTNVLDTYDKHQNNYIHCGRILRKINYSKYSSFRLACLYLQIVFQNNPDDILVDGVDAPDRPRRVVGRRLKGVQPLQLQPEVLSVHLHTERDTYIAHT
jgi:hypothetical protein